MLTKRNIWQDQSIFVRSPAERAGSYGDAYNHAQQTKALELILKSVKSLAIKITSTCAE